MSAILYNTNSSLIPKFQKYRQHRGPPDTASPVSPQGNTAVGSDFDSPFKSVHEKNSDRYLQDLCCSVYPSSLRQRVYKLNAEVDLPVHAFMCLIWKNFVTSWYGTKIPAPDDKFMVQLFEIVDEIVSLSKTLKFSYDSFLTDDLPLLLAQHVRTMRLCLREKDAYTRYCELTSYEQGYYPRTLSHHILSLVRCESSLQMSFLQALFDELLLGKVLDKVTEPYFVILAIDKLCDIQESRQSSVVKEPKQWSFQDIKRSIAMLGRAIALMTSINKDSENVLSRPFPYIGAFTLLADVLKLPERKPFLYALGKSAQYWCARSKSLNAIMENLFFNVLSRFRRRKSSRSLFTSLRAMLFPNDNKLGSGRVIPVDEEYNKFIEASIEKQAHAIESSLLNTILSVDRSEIRELNEIITRDKRCNKLIIMKILDCLMAQTSVTARP